MKVNDRTQIAARLHALADRVAQGEIPLFGMIYIDPDAELLPKDAGMIFPSGLEGSVRTYATAASATDPRPAHPDHFARVLGKLKELSGLFTALRDRCAK